MTLQERDLVRELFDRLATLESGPRDPDAEGAIAEGLGRAPHATYALVQTVLVQDEALKRAHARIEELEAPPAEEPPRSFLDNMRDSVFDPYATTKSEGTGLGLAIVKKIVDEHGGTIGYETRRGGDGSGTTFTVRLPLERSAGISGRDDEPAAPDAGARAPDPA